jgi:hypothetical protein
MSPALERFIDELAAWHSYELTIAALALRARLAGRSYTRSLGQLRRWHPSPKEPTYGHRPA